MAQQITTTIVPTDADQAFLLETPLGMSFGAAVPGGFADCSFGLDGDWRRLIPHLSTLRVMYGSAVVWEGQVEDVDAPALTKTSIAALGWRRLLEEESVSLIYRSVDVNYFRRCDMVAPGGYLLDVAAGYTREVTDWYVTIGEIDNTGTPGIRLGRSPTGGGVTSGEGVHFSRAGIVLNRIKFTLDLGNNSGVESLVVASSADGATWTVEATYSGAVDGNKDIALSGSPVMIRILSIQNQAQATVLTNIRVFGAGLNEDTSEGLYGGSIMRDLIARVPGVASGTIEDASDFAIPKLERTNRTAALSVVEEIASYYTRDWAVWENKRFDWISRPAAGETTWTVSAAAGELGVDGTLAGIASDVYVVYNDAYTGVTDEQHAASTSPLNPYVAAGRTRDLVFSPGFPMTATSALALAQRIISDQGDQIPVQGSFVLPCEAVVQLADGAAIPAILIRPGGNLTLYDIPPDIAPIVGVRDGRRVFRIVATNVDVESMQVTLTLEGHGRTVDALIARLASVTAALSV